MGGYATIFTGLEKHTDYIKDFGQRMDDMCLIKTYDPQRFSHIWNELENGTILGEFTNMYLTTISKTYEILL